MDTKKDIGAAVKNKLLEFKDSPDDLIWHTIEAELKKKKKKRAFIWFSGIGLALIILTLWLVSPFDTSNKPANPMDYNANNKSIIEPKTKPIINSTDANISEKNQHYKEDSTTFNTKEKAPESSSHNQKPTNKQSIVNSNKSTRISQDEPHNTRLRSNTKTSAPPKANTNNSTMSRKETASQTTMKLQNNQDTQVSESKSVEGSSTKALALQTRSAIKKRKQAQRDSILAIRENIKDSIKAQRQSKPLVLEETEDEKIKDSTLFDHSRWSITPQLSLSTYGAFKAKATDNFSVNYGVLASYRMTNYTYLRIGVRKLDLNQTIDGNQKNVEYLEFPLDIKYVPFHKKINPYITGGLSYFSLQNVETSDANSSDYKATVSFNLGLGVETKLFNSFYFNIEPNFNYQLNPFNQNNDINPFIFSINTGIEYRF